MLFVDGSLEGEIDLQIYRCLDPDAKGFENVPRSGCAEAKYAFDVVEWEGYLDATFTSHKGVICTSEEDASNHPKGKFTNYS